ncbi:MAG: hypothetical protein ACE5MI_04915 [Acidimicrobiia bacterium]
MQPDQTCVWCGAAFVRTAGPGRPRLYCRRSHRQRHHEAKTLGTRMGLGTDDVLIGRDAYRSVRDQIYVLQAALEDAAADLGEGAECIDVLNDLRGAARPLVRIRWDPKAVGS